MNTSRQAGLPKPKPTVDVGQGGLLMPMSGRVTYVHDGEDYGHVDVFLDNGSVLEKVPVMTRQSGSDRAADDIPPKRSLVVIQFLWGNKSNPYVAGVLPRRTKTKSPPPPKAYRRIWPSGMHLMVDKDGNVETRFADGSSLVIGAITSPAEDHTGKPQEADVGNPMKDVPDVNHAKPGAYKLTLKMASGVTFKFDGSAWVVEGMDSAHFKASSSIKLQVGLSGLAVSGTGVAIVGPSLQWFPTPLTAASFPPAGLVNLIPLPGMSPLGLLP